MFQPLDSEPRTHGQRAEILLEGLRHLPTSGQEREDQLILCITSCLGGILLIEALVIAKDPATMSGQPPYYEVITFYERRETVYPFRFRSLLPSTSRI